MQRVVRSTLVGLLTVAGLAACGDKITIPPQITTPISNVVREVTVSPSSLTIPVAGTATLAASVNADAGVTDRTVTWSSSNAAIATVDATGLVRGVAAGTTTIRATSKADANVSGAASVTVTGGGVQQPPTVTISVINQNPTGQPANLNAAGGQLDVVLNVETNGQQLRSVSATMNCQGGTSMTQTQTISGAVQADADASSAQVPIVLPFNTTLFNATTGVPSLRNGQCGLTATAVTGGGTQTATFPNVVTLANADGVVITETFAPFTNAEGVTTVTSATDGGGLPWKGGAVTVTALPVLYSGRVLFGGATPGSITIALPGAAGNPAPIVPTAAGAVSATWSATAGNGTRVTGQTLVGAGFEANGTTPLGIVPTVIALDNAGNDLNLGVLNLTQPSLNLPNPAFRLDNTPPQPPTTFMIAARQAGWTNAAYTFTGTGGASFTPATGTTKYVSCGDGVPNAAGAGYACAAQVGVSNAGVSGNTGLNGLTTFTYYSIPTASYVPASATNGTSTSATSCATTGWTKITTAGDLAATLSNTAYVVRLFEMDKMNNARCTDLSSGANLINTGAFTRGTFGQDKLPPTAVYIEPATDPTAAADNGALAVGGNIANFNIKIALSDDASGFSGLPINTMVQRLAINPATGAAANINSTYGCPSGLDNNNNCTTTATAQNVPGNFGVVTVDGVNGSGCAGCGYYFFTQTPLDLARNTAPTMTRKVVVDQQIPIVGGIQVPATITGGASASFATSAADNLDLISSDYTLTYAANPAGNPVANLPIRATGPALGVAFDNVLTNASSFSVNVPFFIRSVATTTAGDAPQNNGAAGLPNQMTVRAYDAANNASAPGVAAIAAANVPQTGRTDFTVAPAGANPGATMLSFAVRNSPANISNCPAAGCAGGAAPVNPTSITLNAAATGNEGPTFQFINPFTQVQFYYFDTVTNEYVLIGSAVAPVVTDNAAVTIRTFTWTMTTAFDPPASLGSGAPLRIIAIGVNAQGDGLSTQVFAGITLTNP